jgi:hypothetical protein
MANFAASDSFDTYSDGDLNGGNDGTGWAGAWSGGTEFDIQGTTTVNSQGKAVQMIMPGGTEPLIDRQLSAAADGGNIYFSMRRDTSTDDAFTFGTYDGSPGAGTLAFYVQMTSGSNIDIGGTTAQTIVSSISLATWYDIHVEYVTSTTAKARAKLSTETNWGSFTSAITLSNSKAQFTYIRVSAGQNGAGSPTFYFDRLQSTEPEGSFVPKIIIF